MHEEDFLRTHIFVGLKELGIILIGIAQVSHFATHITQMNSHEAVFKHGFLLSLVPELDPISW